jgi:hypothetical protein
MKNIILFFVAFGLAASTAHAQTVVNITATDSAAAETWPGQATDSANVRITRTGSTTSALAVWVKVSGSAVRNSDYSFGITVGAFVTIPAMRAEVDLPIYVLDDALTEGVETVRIDLDDNTSSGAPVPYTIGDDDRAEVSIADNDDPNLPPRVVVSVGALRDAAEGANGARVAGAFQITRTANLDVEVTVAYAVGGSAVPGSDYEPLTGNVTIPAGVGFAEVTVTPLDDAVLESPESVTLTILPSSCPGIFPPPPECYTIGSQGSARIAILDNEIPPPPPTVRLEVRQDTNVFGFPAAVNGLLSAVAPTGQIASYEARLDGVIQFSGNVNYSEAQSPGTPFEFSFSMTNLTGGSHTVQAAVTDDQGLSARTERTLFIAAIQPPPPPPATYSIVALDSEAAETAIGEAPQPARFLFTRTGTPRELEFFNYSFTGSAREGVDYTVSYGPAILTTNGVTNILTQEITINPVDDLFIEGTETVKMELCFPIIVIIYGVGAPIGVSCTGDVPGLNSTINIFDNDNTPPPFPVVSVAVADAEAQEVSSLSGEPQNPGEFVITRSGPATNDLIVNYSLGRPSTAAGLSTNRVAQNGMDYELLSGMAVIPMGELNTTVSLNPIYDTWAEGDETATLTLLPATNSPTPYLLDAGVINSASVIIRDYAPTSIPVLSVAASDAQAYEQNVLSRTASFLVRRTGSLAESVTAPYELSGAAINGVDYVELPGVVTIPAGSSSATIVINPIADGVAEPVETVGLALQAAALDVFPPPYLLSATPTLRHEAGVSIRDQLLPPQGLTRRQRIVWLWRHRHVVMSLPMPVAVTSEVATSWAIEASSDLRTWQEIGVTEDPEEFVDVSAGDAPMRFYRFRQLSSVVTGP